MPEVSNPFLRIMQMVIDPGSENQADKNPGKEQAKTRSKGKQVGLLGLRKNRLVRNRQVEPQEVRPKTITGKYSTRLKQSGNESVQSWGLNTGENRCVRWVWWPRRGRKTQVCQIVLIEIITANLCNTQTNSPPTFQFSKQKKWQIKKKEMDLKTLRTRGW